jgi:hypothetical protein
MFKFGKNVLKLLDNVNVGLLTLNRIKSAGKDFGGIYTDINFDELKSKNKSGPVKYEKVEIIKPIQVDNKIPSVDIKVPAIPEPKVEVQKVETKPTEAIVPEEIKEEPFLIKSDKLKFHGKSSRIPVSSFSRAVNFGMLGVSLLGNTLSQKFIDKVIISHNKG